MTEFEGVQLTPEESLAPEFVVLCKSISAKRARTVIDHILKHGIITNEDLSDQYGYDHPPRAARDVRENGIPLHTHRVTSPKTHRQIGAYTFGDISLIKRGRIGGRKAFSKQFKQDLIKTYGARDAITSETLDERYLQIDHRIPYEVGGDGNDLKPENYMLLDASSQRAKSWSCEHCVNFLSLHAVKTCETCFWASPESYEHIAMQQIRRVEIEWAGDEVRQYENLKASAKNEGLSIQSLIKRSLKG
jgi:hypothetical protein